MKGKFPNGLKEAMAAREIGPTALAKAVDTAKQNIQRWADQERKLPIDWAVKIAPHVGRSPEDLFFGPSASRAVAIPVLSWVSAGRLGQAEPVSDAAELRRITVADLEPGNWVALEVKGGSMDRIAPDGSVIIVNRDDTRLLSDRFYVFAYSDGQSTFKRYRPNPPRFAPFSFDPDEETIHPEGDWRVFGRVRRVITDLR